MSVVDSIQEARQRGASDDAIVQEILKQNPDKAPTFQQAQKMGANSSQILDEVVKQNSDNQVSNSAQSAEATPDQGFFSKLANTTLNSNPNASDQSFLGQLVRGVTSPFQVGALPGQVASNYMTAGAQQNVNQGTGQLGQVNNAIIQKLHTMQPNDPRTQGLLNALKGSGQAYQVAGDVNNALGNSQVSPSQALGSGLNADATIASFALPGAGSFAGKVGQGLGFGYASDVANNLQNNSSAPLTPGLGTVVGGGIPFVSHLTAALTKGTLGVTTGVGKDVLQQALDNPGAVATAAHEFAQTPEAKQSLVDTAKQALQKYLQERNSQFSEGISQLVSSEPIPKQTVLDSFENAIDGFGGKVKNGALSFGDTTLNSAEQKSVKDVYGIIKSWKDVTPQGLDKLRQRIGNEMDNFKFGNNGRDSVILGKVKSDLTNVMKDKIPGYGDLLSTYGKQSDAARSLATELSTRGSAKPATQLRQVLNIFNKDPQTKANLEKVLGKDTNKFLNDVSGAILSDWIPQGILGNSTRALLEGGGLLAGLAGSNPAITGTALTGAAASSPRIVGKGMTLLGHIVTPAKNAGVGTAITRAGAIGASRLGAIKQ